MVTVPIGVHRDGVAGHEVGNVKTDANIGMIVTGRWRIYPKVGQVMLDKLRARRPIQPRRRQTSSFEAFKDRTPKVNNKRTSARGVR